MNRIRYGTLIVALLLALILSAFNTAPAFADEATPPADETTSEEVVVDETEPTTSEEEATPPDVSEVDSAPAEESTTVAEVIESLPAETALIVLDESGETLPLASEEAAEVVYNGDPLWCPAGVAPKPGIGGCSPSFTSFNNDGTLTDAGLIAWLNDPLNATATSKAGVIWIAYNYAAVGVGGENGSIEINGTLVGGGGVGANMENFALTIQGGWNGTSGSTALNTTTPYSIIENPFHINNWVGAVTINNLLVTGASGVDQAALNVSTDGNITLNNVDAQNNTTNFGGVRLDNVGGTGNIVVNDSTFNNNTFYGISIISTGTVTFKNVTANGNEWGTGIYNDFATTPKAVTLNGTNHFSYNGLGGLEIDTKGVVTLNNMTAMGNGAYGVIVDNCNYNYVYSYCDFGVANGVTIKGTNNFNNNGWDGLRVFSGGAITVNNITANGNGTDGNRPAVTFPTPDDYNAFGKGVFLHNYGAWTAKPVTITGTNTFNDNASTGLLVYSFGAIKANNITANENGCDTLKDTDPDFCAGAYLDGNGVTLIGYSYFIDNARDGLIAYSYDVPISLSNLYAKGNDETGVVVFVAANVTILGTNIFLENNGAGLAVYSTGVVTLNNLTANNNGFEGVYVNNTYATKPMAVIIKGTSTFNGNDYGLVIWSYGAITTNGITALYNEYGVYLNNCDNDGNPECLAYSPQPVTMNGYNNISYNNVNGLEIRSFGAITVNNITANFNLGGFGAYLDNWWEGGAKGGVTIKGYGMFSNNGDFHGLTVWSTGAVTLANLTANSNAQSGVAILNNYDELKPANVTITGTNTFNLNDWSGLKIFTFGAVTLSNITANQNNGTHPTDEDFGVTIDNATDAVLARPVTLNGTNTFNNNIGGGLFISSLGAIKLNNVMANGNEEADGIYLNNQFDLFTSPVTITGYGVFNQNFLAGMLVYSNGAVNLTNLTANNNSDFGVSIDNYYNALSTSTVNVTITGTNTFNDNATSGLQITTDGAITISNITANDNGGHGADLNNSTYAAGAIKNIVLSGSNMFNNNTLTGLTFNASGVVTLTRITANYNHDGVVDAEFSAGIQGTAGSTITLTCGWLYNNEGNGYNLTGTAITLSGVYTSGSNTQLGTLKLTRACLLP